MDLLFFKSFTPFLRSLVGKLSSETSSEYSETKLRDSWNSKGFLSKEFLLGPRTFFSLPAPGDSFWVIVDQMPSFDVVLEVVLSSPSELEVNYLVWLM